jgi:hypothetical protein
MTPILERVKTSFTAFRAKRRERRLAKLEESLSQHGPGEGPRVGSGGHEGSAMSRVDGGSGG